MIKIQKKIYGRFYSLNKKFCAFLGGGGGGGSGWMIDYRFHPGLIFLSIINVCFAKK